MGEKDPKVVQVDIEGSLIVDGVSKQSFTTQPNVVNQVYKLELHQHGVMVEGAKDKKLVPWTKVKSVTFG